MCWKGIKWIKGPNTTSGGDPYWFFSTCQCANHGIFEVQRLFALHNPKRLSVKSGKEKWKKAVLVRFSFLKVWISKCIWWREARPGWDGESILQYPGIREKWDLRGPEHPELPQRSKGTESTQLRADRACRSEAPREAAVTCRMVWVSCRGCCLVCHLCVLQPQQGGPFSPGVPCCKFVPVHPGICCQWRLMLALNELCTHWRVLCLLQCRRAPKALSQSHQMHFLVGFFSPAKFLVSVLFSISVPVWGFFNLNYSLLLTLL